MKNTSLFASFWAMPKGRPSVEPPEALGSSVTLAPGVIGGAEWRPLIANYKQAIEHTIMGVTESENSSLENFPFRNVYYGMRSAKQKMDTKFFVENGEATFSKGKFLFIFTFELVEHSSMEKRRSRKYAKSGKFPRLLLPLVHL